MPLRRYSSSAPAALPATPGACLTGTHSAATDAPQPAGSMTAPLRPPHGLPAGGRCGGHHGALSQVSSGVECQRERPRRQQAA